MKDKLTYRSLLDMLNHIPEEHLDDNPAVYLKKTDEVVPVDKLVLNWVDEVDQRVDGILDEHHPYFTIDF